ncbi:hypothetical protein SESBI_00804 [Sesbania bispinosa]|nr:hypothetical protein SESBI_00804 [Sesbania bispinosa]
MTEPESIHHFFKGKTIFVTGATGCLGKVFVEKILRVQPDIKKLYILLRASNSYLATQRLHNEVIGKELFRVQREKLGADFGPFISKKVVAVAGDVSLNNLGLEDQNMRDEMLKELDIIVHTAATTTFDERYDIAMGTNTMGALHILKFAKNCPKLGILLHLSTAFVCGESKGLIVEEPLHIGRNNINLEKHLIQEKLIELHAHNLNEEAIASVMRSFGLLRSNMHGWPNTYVFTKAMGEMLLAHMKDTLPLIIIRPTIVTSTYSEPFPGWIEGVRTMDFVVAKYGNGTMSNFVGNPDTILDVIPADMVVNSMMVALVAHCKCLSQNNLVYHIGSSLRNPFKISDLLDMMYCYFTRNPCVNKYGKPIVLTRKLILFSNMDKSSQNKGSKLGNAVDLYRPYSLFQGIFDVKNTESLRMATKGFAGMNDIFNFDPKSISWKDYMMNVHFLV